MAVKCGPVVVAQFGLGLARWFGTLFRRVSCREGAFPELGVAGADGLAWSRCAESASPSRAVLRRFYVVDRRLPTMEGRRAAHT